MSLVSLPSLSTMRLTAFGRMSTVMVAGVSLVSPREVMNIKESSVYLGISPDTLYRYVYNDRIPAFKLGNRWKFKKAILDRWMERKIVQGKNRRRRAKG